MVTFHENIPSAIMVSWSVFLASMGCLYVFLRGLTVAYGFDRVFRFSAVVLSIATFAFALTTPSTALGTFPQHPSYEQADAFMQRQIEANTRTIEEIKREREIWRSQVESRMAVLENNSRLLQGVFDRIFWLWLTVGAQFVLQVIGYFFFRRKDQQDERGDDI